MASLNWGAFFKTLADAFNGKLQPPTPEPLTYASGVNALSTFVATLALRADEIREGAGMLDDMALALAAAGVKNADEAASLLSPAEIDAALAMLPTVEKYLTFFKAFQAATPSLASQEPRSK